jgi:hypothetical protein
MSTTVYVTLAVQLDTDGNLLTMNNVAGVDAAITNFMNSDASNVLFWLITQHSGLPVDEITIPSTGINEPKY